MDEARKISALNRNVKMSPLFIALAWDVFFVWTISTMFFHDIKELSYSNIIMLDSILMFIGCIICIPLTKLFEKVKPVLATQIGLVGYMVYLLICILGPKGNFLVFACAQFFLSFGYIVCGIKSNTALTNSLHLLKRDGDYQRVYGNGLSMVYVLEAVGAVLITYIYSWNPFACYWASFGVVVFAEIWSLFITDPDKFQKSNIKVEDRATGEENKKKKKGKNTIFKILGSTFFVFLLVFMFIMRGTLSIVSSGFKTYLQQMMNGGHFPMWLFGYVYAAYKLCSALASRYQFKLDLRYGVRSIILFTTLTVVSFVICGVAYLINPTSLVTLIIIIVFTFIEGMIFAPCRIFVNNYMQVCIEPKDIETAYSIRTTVEYLGYALISMLYANLLSGYGDNYGKTSLVYMAILVVPIAIATALFIRALCKQYAQKYTIVKDKYSKD